MADSASSSSLIDLVAHDWKQINLPGLRSELDDKLMEFDRISKENKEHRKEVAKQTKALQKCPKDQKLKRFGAVLRLYQKHISLKDSQAESLFETFLKIYKVLSEAPDPVDALQGGQIEILKLKSSLLDYSEMKIKLTKYEDEFHGLKNQEITVKKLKERIKKMEEDALEQRGEDLVQQEKEMTARFRAEMEEMEQTLAFSKQTIQALKDEVLEYQQRLDDQQNQFLSQSMNKERDHDIEESTHQMLEVELERANMTVLSLRKERDQLMAAKEQENRQIAARNEEMLQFEMNALKKRLAESKETVNSLQMAFDQTKDEYAEYKRVTASKLQSANEMKERLRKQLQRLPTESEYQLLREKVTVLQHSFLDKAPVSPRPMGLNLGPDQEHNADADTMTLPFNASMDLVVNTKIQSLQSEVNALKMDVHSKNTTIQSLQSTYDEVKRRHEEQSALVLKLENDLTRKYERDSVSTSKNASPQNESVDSLTTNHNLYRILNSDPVDERKVKEVIIPMQSHEDEYASMPLAPPQGDRQRRSSSVSGQSSSGDRHRVKEEDSAFLIICQQRDRFRNKAKDLEATKIRMESKMDRLTAENSTLKKENVELYSKIKFLESYNSAKRSFTPHSAVSTNRRGGARAEEVEMKYENLYELEMNPFNQFRRRQMEHRIANLPWTEWIAFMVGSTVMSKRVFRAFGVFYALGLHLLVFFTLFHEYRTHHIFDHHTYELDQPLPVLIELDAAQDTVHHHASGLGGIGDSGE